MQDASDADVRAALEALVAERPDLCGARVTVLGRGLDHCAYRVGDLVLRLRGDDGEDLQREAALLEVVRRRCVVAVPVPVAGGAAWFAYPLLEGVPLLDFEPQLRARHAGRVAVALGDVLAGLWATPPEEIAGLVEEDRTPPGEWREEAVGLAARLATEVPACARAGLERFLREPPPAPARTLVFSHNDLGCEHVLAEPRAGRVTGILDWSDAALVDPAKDLGLLLRDLGTGAFRRAARAAGRALATHDGLESRARFYAHCLALEDLAFGLESDQPRYAEAARVTLARLTAADTP
ncbi:MAG TPA: aminoglycoside phosphotransferase family protein [Conexibacter sp.]|nr:aminoglycoside phosphotransferase family protein [Conexibacter sp.]